MVTSSGLVELLRAERVLPIIRSGSSADAVAIARTLLEAGYRAFEISLTTPGAFEAIAETIGVARTSGVPVDVGAGTVLTEADAAAARDAGASFIVTPALAASVAASTAMGLPAIVGALTPSEIVAASAAGAAAVKIFPAQPAGPAYFSALRAPFPDVPFVPVGGITLDRGRDYLGRGAVAVGVGSPLTGPASDPPDLIAIAERAAAFASLRSAR